MRKWSGRGLFLLCILIGVVLSVGCQGEKIENVSITWRPFTELSGTFPANTRATMLYISQSNCHYCHKMKDTIFARPEIAWYVNEHFDAVELNLDRDLPVTIGGKEFDYSGIHELLSIPGIPCYYFFSPEGKITGILEGAQEVRDFKRILVYSNGGYFGTTPYGDWLKTPEAEIDTLYGYW